MHEKIAKLSELFKQRDAIDSEIIELIGSSSTEAPKTKTTKRKYKKREITASSEERGKKYRCEECSKIFFSTADYKDVRCKCGAKRVISLP